MSNLRTFSYFIFWLLLSIINTAYAQQYNYYNQSILEHRTLNHIYFNTSINSSIKPVLVDFDSVKKYSVIEKEKATTSLFNLLTKAKFKKMSWLKRKFFYENFLIIDTSNFYLTIDPLINFSFGKTYSKVGLDKKLLYKNRRGIILKGHISKYLAFSTSFIETQALFSDKQFAIIDSIGATIGQGTYKIKTSHQNSELDYGVISSYISITPNKFIHLQLGNNNYFIGYGRSSLITTDNTANIPNIRLILQSRNKKLSYSILYGQLVDLVRRPKFTAEGLYKRKALRVNHLSWQPNKKFSISLSETMVFKTEDTSRTLPFNTEIINPIIGLNTLISKRNSSNYYLLGTSAKLNLYPFMLYSQLASNVKSSYWGVQTGIRMVGLKDKLTINLEWNNLFNTQDSLSLQRKSHFGQGLAMNPEDEVSVLVNYNYKRFIAETVFNTKLGKINLHNTLMCVLNNKNNLNISFQHYYNDIQKVHTFVFGISTSILNNYNKL